MKTIKLMNEFLRGVIWTQDEDGILTSDISIVANDLICQKLNKEIGDMYNSYYEFDRDEACYFNKEQQLKDKEKMLSLLNQLIERLNEINDGSFLIDDYEIRELKRL